MLHDIAPAAYDNEFSFPEARPEDKLIIYRGKTVLAFVEDDVMRAPTFADFGLDPRVDCRTGLQHDPLQDHEDPEVLLAHEDPIARDTADDQRVLLAHEDPRAQEAGDGPRVLLAHEDPVAHENDAAPKAERLKPYVYLFTVGEDRYFMVDLPAALVDRVVSEPGWEFIPLQKMVDHQPKQVRFALMVGHEYWNWYESSQYCGRCGAKTEHDTVERMMRCPECGLMIFPKVFPAVIVAITRPDGKVLATRYAGRPYANYALVAGYCEMGETVEQTVHREVMEEVGLRVKNLRYYKSQPWPDSSSLLFGFFCELDGSPDIVLDEHELSVAEWVDRDQLLTDNDHSLTREMMGVLREHRETDYCITQA